MQMFMEPFRAGARTHHVTANGVREGLHQYGMVQGKYKHILDTLVPVYQNLVVSFNNLSNLFCVSG